MMPPARSGAMKEDADGGGDVRGLLLLAAALPGQKDGGKRNQGGVVQQVSIGEEAWEGGALGGSWIV